MKQTSHIDWILFSAILPILGVGLLTMDSFGANNGHFDRQLIWIVISIAVFFALSFIDFNFLKRTPVVATLFGLAVLLLTMLFVVGHISKGAESWFSLGGVSFEPADPVKLILIIVLAKYFSRRHVEIAHFSHLVVSGVYALILFFLVLLQPDFGGALVIFLIWLGLVLVSGISKKHIAAVFGVGALAFLLLWVGVLHPYQKQRIETFLHPLADVRGAGYNAYQSTITVGSGQLLGKGLGYGTQSRLRFLPEYQTDFVFAAFAEEWGFVGVILVLILYSIVIWRILANAMRGAGNFEMLFGIGLALFICIHFFVNVGMNIGLLPVTGINVPFMSYGGTYLLTVFTGLGILMGMRRYAQVAHKNVMDNEFFGL